MFKGITLELSLKPFKSTDDAYIRGVCYKLLSQWHSLLLNRKIISVMLWTADGSEILDYTGELDKTFEWCRFVGTANKAPLGNDEPKETSLHERRQDYMENPPIMTYRVLKKIVSTIKEVAHELYPDSQIRVGETFDIGPEFAISDFKYRRHNEICSGAKLDTLGFIDATATLFADDYSYAAYPSGIPDGLPFGTFLGAQSSKFLPDMGFDYLWLSNGLGFSSNPWDPTGKIFDGENFHPEKLADTKRRVFDFWRLFREACPDIPLEVRGTNNSVGIDYSTDGVPLYDIYSAKELGITAPPNSPWAAINDNFGLELMGHMTRICELPSENFPFRYYLHDPWWINSPWYDRYDGTPCDVYMPAMISRITENGEVESANTLNILSVDNSYGTLPDATVNEVVPHILKAEKNSPDEPAPIVWVYPMREYTTADGADILREMNLGDNFICSEINNGFPLCCVTSTDSFMHQSDSIYEGRILLSPVPERKEVAAKLSELARAGAGVIIYGTDEALSCANIPEGALTVSVQASHGALRAAIEGFGYSIRFEKRDDAAKVPTMTISRYDGAFMLSAYNSNTTTETALKFPLGAPILVGIDCELRDGYSHYRFARSEHRECRVFLNQSDGVIVCREAAPVSTRYRRRIKLTGLKNATLYFFTEKGCEATASRYYGDETPYLDLPVYYGRNAYGNYMKIENVSGEIYLLMGHRGTL